jgi:hypothetical protein
VARIIVKNPRVDASAIERSREIARKLGEAGIEQGTYRLEPALGGEFLKRAQSDGRASHRQKKP